MIRSVSILLFVITAHWGLTQNFQPFNDTIPKRFAEVNNSTANDYFFYPISTEISGDSTLYSQYFRLSSYYEYADPVDCPNWGSDYGLIGDTTWLGRQFIYDTNLNALHLTNANNEVLDFNFSVLPGDSSIVYQSLSDEYYLKFTSELEEIVLSVTDTVRTYQLLHYDNTGQPVNSALNNFEIKVGKELGMIKFIDCNNFPMSEVGLELLGQINPLIGYYQMTYDEMYPWQAGDIVEYQGSWSLGGSIPSPYTINYRLLSITNRVETSDSVFIYYDLFTRTDTIDMGYTGWFGTFNIVFPMPLVYKKGKQLSEVPFGCMPYNGWHTNKVSTPGGSCTTMKVYFDENFDYYCDSCECMLPYDGFGTSTEHFRYEKERGLTSHHYNPYGGTGAGNGAGMIYSKIAGVECGTIEYLGIEEISADINISPNPFLNKVHVNSSKQIDEIIILDLSGKVLGSFQDIIGNSADLNLSYLNPGVYIINIKSSDGDTHSEKMIRL